MSWHAASQTSSRGILNREDQDLSLLSLPQDTKESWVIAFTALTDRGVSVANRYLVHALPQMLATEMRNYKTHTYSYWEKTVYRKRLVDLRLLSWQKELDRLREGRDALLFQKGELSSQPSGTSRNIQAAIEWLKSQDLEDVSISEDKPVLFLDGDENGQLSDPSVSGRYIDKLSSMRVEAAINTDRLYGKVLAYATRTMLRQAFKDGMRENLPVCLGGKPSYALPYFGPSAQRALARLGLSNYLRPSVIDERGSNANLVGAAVLAEKVWKENVS